MSYRKVLAKYRNFYKTISKHNAAEIVNLDDGITWKRFPEDVCDSLEIDKEQKDLRLKTIKFMDMKVKNTHITQLLKSRRILKEQ